MRTALCGTPVVLQVGREVLQWSTAAPARRTPSVSSVAPLKTALSVTAEKAASTGEGTSVSTAAAPRRARVPQHDVAGADAGARQGEAGEHQVFGEVGVAEVAAGQGTGRLARGNEGVRVGSQGEHRWDAAPHVAPCEQP